MSKKETVAMKSEQTEVAKPSRNELRRARMRAIVLAAAALISILFFIYGHIQKMEAEKNYELAEQNRIEAEKQHDTAVVAQYNASMLAQQLSKAIQSLEGCQKNRK